MKTKYLVRFLNNSAHLDADLELVDIIQVATSNSRLNSADSTHIFDYVDTQRHQKLTSRANSDHSRKLAANHLKTTIRAAFIKSLYETTTIYFQGIGHDLAYFKLWQNYYKRKVTVKRVWDAIVKVGSVLAIILSIIKLWEIF